MNKRERQQKLVSIITTHRIKTQTELASRLEQAGVEATQSSVSRDLEELGIVKRAGRYSVPQASSGARGLLSLETAGDALLVARCEPGLASAVAVEIDRAAMPEIVGTLAGEDTVFVAIANRKAQRTATKKIWLLFS